MPWRGPPGGKEASELVVHWMHVTGSHENIPSNLAETLTQAPNLTVLTDAGLTVIGTYEFTRRLWTLETLAGFAHSTSILSCPPWHTRSKPSSVTCETASWRYSPTATSKNQSASPTISP